MTVAARVEGSVIKVWAPYSPEGVRRAKSIVGARWSSAERCWTYPATPASAAALEAAWGRVEGDTGYAALLEQGGRLEQAQAIKTATSHELEPPPSKTASWLHQTRAYHFAREVPAAMLHMGMRTGKSKVVVDLICNDRQNNPAGLPYLILAPSVVLTQWVEQFKMHGATPVLAVALPTEGGVTTAGKVKLCIQHREEASRRGVPLVIILNYESARSAALGGMLKRKRQGTKHPGWLLNQQWRMVIADESQKIKDSTGLTGKLAAELSGLAQKRLCLTGTPMPHDPLDVFGQFQFLDPSVFGDSWTRFKSHYAQMHPYVEHKVEKYINQDEMAQKMAPLTFQAPREVLDLPPVLPPMYRTYRLSDAARRHYDELENDLITAVREGMVTAANAAVKSIRLRQVCSGFVRTEAGEDVDIDDGRRKLLEDGILDGMEKNEPLVVYATFQHDLDAIHLAAKRMGRTSYELSGRRKELKTWQDATGGEVLATQIDAGGIGISLSRAAYCCYYTVGWNRGNYEQSVPRIHDTNQTRPVGYYYLLAEDTIDETIYAALRNGHNIVEAVLAKLRQQPS